MPRKTESDYRTLAKERGFTWAADVPPKSTKKNTLWCCSKGHIFPRAYSNLRGPARKCPICNGGLPRLVDAHPEQVEAYFDPERNPDVEIAFVMSGSSKQIEWYCNEHDRSWPAAPYTIVQSWCAGRSGCSDCSEKTKKTAEDYRELARRRGFKWLGTKVPKDNKTKTDWLCDKEHLFDSTYNQIDKGNGCKYCSGRVASPENNLAVKFPEVAKLWHPTKNDDLRPEAVTPHSHDDEIWWLCPKNPALHDWQASPKSVVRSHNEGNTGCPFCSGHKVHPEESLGARFPELIDYWHPTKNGNLTPFEVSYGSGKPVYWLCDFEHTTYTSPNNRTSQGGRGCGRCANQTSKLEIRLYVELKTFINEIGWQRKIQGKECDIYLPSARVAIEVDGYKWHKDNKENDQRKTDVFEAQGLTAVRVREIPLPPLRQVDVLFKSSEKQLSIAHELIHALLTLRCLDRIQTKKARMYLATQSYAAEPEYRKILAQLPRPPEGESLLDKVPEISDHWDYDENAPLLPEWFTVGSNKRIYWKCIISHHPPTQRAIKLRVKLLRTGGITCDYCRGKKVALEDSLAIKFPDLAKEYMTTNKLPATKVWPKWTRNVDWKCSKCGHEWPATVFARTYKAQPTGCPECGKQIAAEHAKRRGQEKTKLTKTKFNPTKTEMQKLASEKTFTEIARIFDVDPHFVKKTMLELGLDPKSKERMAAGQLKATMGRRQAARNKLPKTSVLKELYEQKSLQAVAEKFSVTRRTLRKVFIEEGIEIKSRSHRRK